MNHLNMNRRTFLIASASGLGGLQYAVPNLAARPSKSRGGGQAKSTILFFLCGGASHLDTWDMKPKAPAEYRGPFKPIATSAPGVQLSEHLPMLSRQAHHLAVVNSLGAGVSTNDHHAGYYYNLTGHEPDRSFFTLGNNRRPMPDDWPYMGTVVATRVQRKGQLPPAITFPHKPSRQPFVRPGQFAARLGDVHDPIYLQRSKPLRFEAPALVLEGDVDPQRLSTRTGLLRKIDEARRDFDRHAKVQSYSRHQERALSLLASSRSTDAFDLSGEDPKLRQRYGETINGMSLLLARRLVEAGVPFITVFWMETRKLNNMAWDTHAKNFECLKDHLLPEFDRGFSALVEDLSLRSLLDQTLLLVTSEMGRKPQIGDRRSGGKKGGGRDHWTHCMSVLMAGGGVRGGQTYGTSDARGEYPAERPVTPAHVTKTVYHAMGIHDLETHDKEGRVYDLLAEGEPIELF